MKTCKNCGKEVLFDTSPIDDYWYHVDTDLVWCNMDFGGDVAEVDDASKE